MTKTIQIEAMPVRLSEGKSEFKVQLREPGVVRAVGFTLEQRLVLTRGEAQFDEVLSMFIEFAPDGPLRNRHFAVMESSRPIKVPDGYKLTFVGTAISQNTAQVKHVYEVTAVS